MKMAPDPQATRNRVRNALGIVLRDLRSARTLDTWHGRLRLRLLLLVNYALFPADTRVGVYWPSDAETWDDLKDCVP